jgi:two-component system response regulator
MRRSRTILLIEDDEAHAALITRVLEEVSPGAEIRLVCDGEEALEYLFQQGKYAVQKLSARPDLVLLDLRLPRLDGQEVLKAVKHSEALKAIPVAVLTSSESEYDVDTAYRNHASSYLVKPLGFGEFSERLRELSTYWLVKNRLPEKS